MKTNIYISTALISALSLLSACTTPRTINNKPHNLQNGFDATSADADVVQSSHFHPDAGYKYKDKNKNNMIVLNLELAPVDSSITPMPSNVNAKYIEDILQGEIERSKRFSVLDSSFADENSIRLNAKVNISYSERKGYASYLVKMAFSIVNEDGILEFTMNTKGEGYTVFDDNFLPDYALTPSDRQALLDSAIEECVDEVFPLLAKRFPIAGTVNAARYSDNTIMLNVNRDEKDGIVQGMPFVIGYVDSNGNQIYIARGRAIGISDNSTQIEIEAWNTEEEYNAVRYATQRIAQRDEAFIKSMFFVSKYRPYQKK